MQSAETGSMQHFREGVWLGERKLYPQALLFLWERQNMQLRAAGPPGEGRWITANKVGTPLPPAGFSPCGQMGVMLLPNPKWVSRDSHIQRLMESQNGLS